MSVVGDLTLDGRSCTLRPERQAGNWTTACELFPPVGQQRLAQAWGGLQAQTLDDLPLIGSFARLDGLTLALGSWHSFGLAPAIGHCVAEQVAGRSVPELAHLRPERITKADPRPGAGEERCDRRELSRILGCGPGDHRRVGCQGLPRARYSRGDPL
ncbi:MAG: FAD-binding oxidoreductase [Chloroflexales bacterium]|nr:FAD-binding oxidoreductase [Chloroflexales bacterium]